MAFSLKKLFGINFADVVEKIGEAIDKNITNKEEREGLKNKLVGLLLQREQSLQSELTRRLDTDMNSDSWLSKNIRPLSLVFSTAVVVVMTMSHGNIGAFQIGDSYIDLWKSLIIMIYTFYFGSRGVEKIIQSVNKGQETRREYRRRIKEEKND